MLASFRMAATIAGFANDRDQSNNTKTCGSGLLCHPIKSQAKKSPISLKRSIGLEHSGATSAKGGSMRVQA
jgi:hypothetical protein